MFAEKWAKALYKFLYNPSKFQRITSHPCHPFLAIRHLHANLGFVKCVNEVTKEIVPQIAVQFHLGHATQSHDKTQDK